MSPGPPKRGSVRLRHATVLRIRSDRPGVLELDVVVDDDHAGPSPVAVPGPAVAFTQLVGHVEVGDRVLVNTTAVALGLGTGGFHLVVAVDDQTPTELDHPGRVMKARYTPLQVAVQSVEETDREALERSPGLGGRPVVCAPLHSMIGPIAAGARAAGAERIAYVMSDGAALPGRLSKLVPRLRAVGLLDGFVTSGQAFGGELEAVTIWTGVLAAAELIGADVVIVADGPGNLGTDTTWGVSALASGHALNAAEVLGGRPVAALRVSFADARERHRGVSHHSLTILDRVCRVAADVAVPVLEGDERDLVWNSLRSRRLEERHQLVEVDGRGALDELERAGIEIDSMGRTASEDPAFFLAAGAAGILAGRMAAGSRRWSRGAG
ncbi:MAG TPA: DUF3866 family protein [Actinomycetota bacterium]|nr:DUF3866 family protein [Actinomycetota bacterium]